MQKIEKEIAPTSKLREQVEKYISTKNTYITWYNGMSVIIERTNIRIIQPIKIIINKNDKTYVILSYGQYSNDENEIFLYDKTNKISWLKLIELLKNA